MSEIESVSMAGGYGPPGGGYGPPGGGYGGPPPGGGGGGYGGPPGGGGYGPPPGGYGGPPPGGFGPPGPNFGPPLGPMMGPEPSTGLAIGALVVGILAIPGACCCYSSVPLGIAAIVMGIIAMNKAKYSPQAYGGRGLALGGLICGIIGIACTVVVVMMGVGMQLIDKLR